MAYVQADILAEVRELLNEATAGFWTDARLNAIINQAALDLSAKTHCVEATATVTLVQGDIDYALPTAGASFVPTLNTTDPRVIRIYMAYLSNVALMRVHPRVWGSEQGTGQTTPTMVSHFGNFVYVAPPPAAAGTLSLMVSVRTDDIRDIPYHYQHLAIPYVCARAKQKDRKFTEAAQFYAEYTNSLLFQRSDLQEHPIDTKEGRKVPDRLVTPQAGG